MAPFYFSSFLWGAVLFNNIMVGGGYTITQKSSKYNTNYTPLCVHVSGSLVSACALSLALPLALSLSRSLPISPIRGKGNLYPFGRHI